MNNVIKVVTNEYLKKYEINVAAIIVIITSAIATPNNL
jgi:hypothetical protein